MAPWKSLSRSDRFTKYGWLHAELITRLPHHFHRGDVLTYFVVYGEASGGSRLRVPSCSRRLRRRCILARSANRHRSRPDHADGWPPRLQCRESRGHCDIESRRP